jgi:hypothetical protein
MVAPAMTSLLSEGLEQIGDLHPNDRCPSNRLGLLS